MLYFVTYELFTTHSIITSKFQECFQTETERAAFIAQLKTSPYLFIYSVRTYETSKQAPLQVLNYKKA